MESTTSSDPITTGAVPSSSAPPRTVQDLLSEPNPPSDQPFVLMQPVLPLPLPPPLPSSSPSLEELQKTDYYTEFPPDREEEDEFDKRRGVENPEIETDDDYYESEDEEKELERKRALKKASRKYWIQACYISIAAIFGAFSRMLLAQIFGESCANPGTVGWLSSGAPLCVTAEGDILQQGGVLFSDLPANMLGSFFMGMFQDGTVLGLALPMSLAWLKPHHPFQRMPIFHTAFKTGFCGSLTTFSSYNSAMIVLIFGTGSNLPTQIWLAVFGYIIGMECALGSYVCGKSVARYLHRRVNPVLAAEANAVRIRHEEGVYIHWQLPDFERRFLSNLDMGEQLVEFLPCGSTESLERWRKSTEDERRVRHPLLPALLEIEDAVFLDLCAIPDSARSIAKAQGWDIDALQQWLEERTHNNFGNVPSLSTFSLATFSSPEETRWLTLPVAAFLLWLCMFALGMCMLLQYANSDDDAIVTYRTMAYAMLLSPAGALVRWKLTERNGTLIKYPWFPFGTFLANILGSLVSITAVATEYHIESRYYVHGFKWSIGSIRAIRIGFAGCLTTVSTFVAEIHGFMHNHTDHAYPYILTTVGTACVLCTIVYAIIVFAI